MRRVSGCVERLMLNVQFRLNAACEQAKKELQFVCVVIKGRRVFVGFILEINRRYLFNLTRPSQYHTCESRQAISRYDIEPT